MVIVPGVGATQPVAGSSASCGGGTAGVAGAAAGVAPESDATSALPIACGADRLLQAESANAPSASARPNVLFITYLLRSGHTPRDTRQRSGTRSGRARSTPQKRF